MNSIMRTIEDIRRDKLIRLKDQCGSYAALGRKIGRSRAQVWQWINSPIDKMTGNNRSISHIMCRHVETCFLKPTGWMDQELEELEELSFILGVDIKGISEKKVEMLKLLLNVPEQKIEDIIYLTKALTGNDKKDVSNNEK